MTIIDELRASRRDDEWIFPSLKPGRHIEFLVQAAHRIRKRSGVDFVPHDLRRTAASRMTGDLRISRLTVGKILNHVETGVTSVYDRHSYDAEKRQALESWSHRLREILAGDTAKESNVVRLTDTAPNRFGAARPMGRKPDIAVRLPRLPNSAGVMRRRN